MGSHSDLSPALRAANERLLALRAQVAGLAAAESDSLPAASGDGAVAAGSDQPDAAENALPDLLPPHLGWHSPAVSAAMRRRRAQAEETAVGPTETTVEPTGTATGPTNPTVGDASTAASSLSTPSPFPSDGPDTAPSVFAIHPSLALALLRRQQVAAGRLWLLLRALDDAGRGWLNRTDIEAAFAHPDAPTRFCTPRYLRQLLANGDGFFWEREGSDKVWLRGQAKVAAALGISRLHGRTVELPLSVLLGPIGDLRAHLYASFHSGRGGAGASREVTSGELASGELASGELASGELAPPISRAALRELSGASPRTQQCYDARARVEVQPCLAIGGLATTSSSQSNAWQHGRAAFTFTDHRGKQGAAGRRYQAHRLPNRYVGPHPRRGKPKRLNRQLIDLCQQGYAGNGQPESEPGAAARRYYADGAAAGRVWLRQQGRVLVFWQRSEPNAGRSGRRQPHNRQSSVCFWYMLGTGAV